MDNFDDYKLAVTSKLIELESCEENRLAVTCMAQQCTRTLDIISRLLDPPIFDSTGFIEAVRQLVVRYRNPLIRVIVFDPETIVGHGHRLVDLAGDLTSFIQIRKVSSEYNDYNECLLIADSVGYIHRKHADRYEATVNFNDRRQSKHLQKGFEGMWETAIPDPNLRRVNL
ncbi:MAG: hypothetical protein HW411_640 [Gammaproteobacteria bacterium]|nr:hypothetical protein [Gammaproteobacteria bacterium]